MSCYVSNTCTTLNQIDIVNSNNAYEILDKYVKEKCDITSVTFTSGDVNNQKKAYLFDLLTTKGIKPSGDLGYTYGQFFDKFTISQIITTGNNGMSELGYKTIQSENVGVPIVEGFYYYILISTRGWLGNKITLIDINKSWGLNKYGDWISIPISKNIKFNKDSSINREKLVDNTNNSEIYCCLLITNKPELTPHSSEPTDSDLVFDSETCIPSGCVPSSISKKDAKNHCCGKGHKTTKCHGSHWRCESEKDKDKQQQIFGPGGEQQMFGPDGTLQCITGGCVSSSISKKNAKGHCCYGGHKTTKCHGSHFRCNSNKNGNVPDDKPPLIGPGGERIIPKTLGPWNPKLQIQKIYYDNFSKQLFNDCFFSFTINRGTIILDSWSPPIPQNLVPSTKLHTYNMPFYNGRYKLLSTLNTDSYLQIIINKLQLERNTDISIISPPGTCLSEYDISHKIKLLYNDIYSDIQKLLLYKKVNTTPDGYYLNDKSAIERRLALDNYDNIKNINSFADNIFKMARVVLIATAILVFIFLTDKNPTNYVLLCLCIFLTQIFNIYNKLIQYNVFN